MSIDNPRPYYNPDDPDNPYVRFQRDYGGLNFKRLEDLVQAGTGDISGLVTELELEIRLATKADESLVIPLAARIAAIEDINFNGFALKTHLDELEGEFDDLSFRVDQLEQRPQVDLTPYAKTAEVNTAIGAAIDGLIPPGTEGQYLRYDVNGELVASSQDDIDLGNYYTKSETDGIIEDAITDYGNSLPDYLTQDEADARYPLDADIPEFSNLESGVAGQSLLLQPDGSYAPGGVPDTTDLTQYYTKTETDGEIADAIEAHESATDPHSQYQTQAETDARYVQPVVLDDYVTEAELSTFDETLQENLDDRFAGYLDTDATNAAIGFAVDQHKNDADPHPQYTTQSENDARYLQSIPGEYLTEDEVYPDIEAKQDKIVGAAGQFVGFDAEGNAEAQAIDFPETDLSGYYTRTEVDALLGDLTPSEHDHDEYVTQAELDPQLLAKLNISDLNGAEFGDFTNAQPGQSVIINSEGLLIPGTVDAGGEPVDLTNYYTKPETDAEIEDAIDAHKSDTDPHPQYLTAAEQDVNFVRPATLSQYARIDYVDPSFIYIFGRLTTVENGLQNHKDATDPHSQYTTQPENDARYLQSIPAEYVTQAELDPQLATKQDVISGVEGQIVKFDANGDLVAADFEAPDLSDYSTTVQITAQITDAIEDHELAADPHPQYLTETDAGTTYATKSELGDKLDSSELNGIVFGDWTDAVDGQVGKWLNGEFVPATDNTGSPADFSNYYTKTETENEIDDAIAAHVSDTDPHSQYMSVEEGDFRYVQPAALDDYATRVYVDAEIAEVNSAFDNYYTESEVDGLLNSKADSGHSHAIADTSGLQTALDSKLDDNQLGVSIASLVDGKVPAAQLPDLEHSHDEYAPLVHQHAIADVTGLAGELDNKADVDHGHVIADTEGLQTALDSKVDDSQLAGYAALTDGKIADAVIPSNISRVGHTHDYASIEHNHELADVNGLQAALDAKADEIHTHGISDVSGLQSALDGKVDDAQLAGYAALTDGKINAGVIPDLSDTYLLSTLLGEEIAELDGNGKVPAAQLPIGTDIAAQVHTHPYVPTSVVGNPNGVASLDNNGKVPLAQIPDLDQAYATDQALTDAINTRAPLVHTHTISDTTGLQAALDSKLDDSLAGAPNGLATLDSNGLIPVTQIPDLDLVYVRDEDLQGSLDTKSNVGHLHDDRYSQLGHTHSTGAHTHEISEVNGLQTALNGKSNTGHAHVIADTTGLQAALDSKANSTHGHAVSDVTGLQAALDSKAATSHVHTIANVTNLQASLDAKIDNTKIGANSGVAALGSDGKVPLSQLPQFGTYTTGVVPDGSTTPTITHNLNTKDITVIVREVSTGKWIPVSNTATTVNAVQLAFNVAPTAGQYRYQIFSGAPFVAVPSGSVLVAYTASVVLDTALGREFRMIATGPVELMPPTDPSVTMVFFSVLAQNADRIITINQNIRRIGGLPATFTVTSGTAGFFTLRYSQLTNAWTLMAGATE